MVTLEHMVLSNVISAVGLLVVFALKSAPPRLGLWISMFAMASVLVPWALIATSIDNAVPDQRAIFESVVDSFAYSSKSILDSATFEYWDFALFGWFAIGCIWFATTLFGSLKVSHLWHKTAVCNESHQQFIHPTLLKYAGDVKIRRIPSSSVVATTGLLRPVIFIGDRIESGSQIESAINHELCHIARRDQLTLLLIVFLERLWWWNPLVWLLGRHARQCMEFACDDRCKSLLGVQSYRRSLAEILLLNQRPAFPCTISIGTKSDIIQRMENIEMNYKFTSKHALVCAAAALLLSVATLSSAEQKSNNADMTLFKCLEKLPENVKYKFTVDADVENSDSTKGNISVSLIDVDQPDNHEIPEGSEEFIHCASELLGINFSGE